MNLNRRGFLASVATTGVCASTFQGNARAVTLPETDPAAWGSRFSAGPAVLRTYDYRHHRLHTVMWRAGDTTVRLEDETSEHVVVLNSGHNVYLSHLDFQTGYAQHTLASHLEGELVDEVVREIELLQHSYSC